MSTLFANRYSCCTCQDSFCPPAPSKISRHGVKLNLFKARGWYQSSRREPHLHLGKPARAGEGSLEAPAQCMSVEEAWELLLELNSNDTKGVVAQQLVDTRDKRARLREALLVAASSPHVPSGWDPQGQSQGILLGILSSDVRLGVRALRDYCQALGLPFKPPESRVPGCPTLPSISGSVYIKYNSGSGLCYATQYEGSFRGVLVQLGMQQVGHLPLGIMDEDRKNPAPELQ